MTSKAAVDRNSTSLWHLSLLVLIIFGVAFAAPREKPVWVFAAAFGSLLAVAARCLAGLLHASPTRWSLVVTGVCAALGVWSAVLVSITQHYRRDRPKHTLVAQMFQQWPENDPENVSGPEAAHWQGFAVRALRQRYGDFDPAQQRWLWLFLADGAGGGVIAAGLLAAALRLRPVPSSLAEPPA